MFLFFVLYFLYFGKLCRTAGIGDKSRFGWLVCPKATKNNNNNKIDKKIQRVPFHGPELVFFSFFGFGWFAKKCTKFISNLFLIISN